MGITSSRRKLYTGGSTALLKDFLPAKCGINASFVAINDLAAVEAALTPSTKVGKVQQSKPDMRACY